MLKIILIIIFLFPYQVLGETITFAIPTYLPYQYEENGKFTGIDVEIIQEICKRLQIDPDIKKLPWKRCLKAIREGDAHGTFGIYRTEKREGFMYYTREHIDILRSVLVARKESQIKVKSLDDLKGKTVAIMANNSYGEVFDNYQGLKKAVCYEKEAQIRILAKQRVDLAAVDEVPFFYLSNKSDFKDRFEVVYVLSENPRYICFSKAVKKAPELTEKFSKTLKQLKKEGFADKVIANYF